MTNVSNIFSLCFDGINAVFAFFSSVLTSSGFYSYVLGTVVLLIFFRLIIFPLFGGGSILSSAASDSARVNPRAKNVRLAQSQRMGNARAAYVRSRRK